MRRGRRLFLAGLGLTAVVAVGSYWWHLPGLAGSRGIVPLAENLRGLGHLGPRGLPTLLWLSASDAMLHALCAAGVLAGLALVLGLAPRLAAWTLWASWLSLVQAGYPFLAFQWDVLLVETAFCAALAAPPGWRPRLETEPEPPSAFAFLLAFLACKVTLESGIVKLASGDPAWRDLTALGWHWWTQPLPAWTSRALADLPGSVQRALCAAVFVLELPVPLLVLGPRPLRRVGAAGLALLQVGLAASGNYGFYNLLSLVLVLPLLDDALVERLVPRLRPLPTAPAAAPGRWTWVVTLVCVLAGISAFLRWPRGSPAVGVVARFQTLNAYGAFATMTKERREVVLEGSRDGLRWHAYEFPWKPGDVWRRPGFVAPWQPRLDWQMWFAALGTCEGNPWLLAVQRHLLLGTPAVLALFEGNPLPGEPPRVLRTRVFQYRYAPRAPGGPWWTREEEGPYCLPVTLGPDGRLKPWP